MQGVCHLVEDVGGNQLPMLVDLVDLDRPRSERESFDAGVAVSVIGWKLVLFHIMYVSRRDCWEEEVRSKARWRFEVGRARKMAGRSRWKCVGDPSNHDPTRSNMRKITTWNNRRVNRL